MSQATLGKAFLKKCKFLSKYESNPHSPFYAGISPLSKWIDLEVSDENNVTWPIRVEMNYTAAEVSAAGIDEATLAIYYYDGSWEKCSSTGVYTDNNTIWANIAEGELGGSPLNAGGETSGSAPVAVPEYNLAGLIALIAVLSVVLAAAMGKRRKWEWGMGNGEWGNKRKQKFPLFPRR